MSEQSCIESHVFPGRSYCDPAPHESHRVGSARVLIPNRNATTTPMGGSVCPECWRVAQDTARAIERAQLRQRK